MEKWVSVNAFSASQLANSLSDSLFKDVLIAKSASQLMFAYSRPSSRLFSGSVSLSVIVYVLLSPRAMSIKRPEYSLRSQTGSAIGARFEVSLNVDVVPLVL
jgi:hypothetical protein